MPNNVTVIAIDGPAAAGKTVVGRQLAHRLGFKYLDTGLMYRALGWLAKQRNISADDQSALATLAQNAQIRLEGQDGDQVLIGEQRLGSELSDPEVSHWASVVATIPAVRRAMVMLQQSIAADGSIVMVGRDIGTVVVPCADLKIFMTASVEERARRRWRDLSEQGREVAYDQVLQDTRERDHRDSTRTDSPLVPAEDAIMIGTDDLSIDQAVDAILQHLKLKAEK
ncbi:MAG: (d)CMP kinase [Chloroflexi bacterium]|nr:(d)CMP kinase [Chloroflexota bacterium]MDA1219005.1 (d)CMP kinase [Chloroflexota bacterium]PKB57081.1 MAG: cytidylate kinase [SAR202 cluster bacterium Casp-Chloro-G3]